MTLHQQLTAYLKIKQELMDDLKVQVYDEAQERVEYILNILTKSELVLVHDTVGECNPDIIKTEKEKLEIAKDIAQCVLEEEILSYGWVQQILFWKKFKRLNNVWEVLNNG